MTYPCKFSPARPPLPGGSGSALLPSRLPSLCSRTVTQDGKAGFNLPWRKPLDCSVPASSPVEGSGW